MALLRTLVAGGLFRGPLVMRVVYSKAVRLTSFGAYIQVFGGFLE